MHAHEDKCRATCNRFGIKFSGQCCNCEDGAIAKAKQNAIHHNILLPPNPKISTGTFEDGEKFGTDILESKVKRTNIGIWPLTIELEISSPFLFE